MNMIQSFLQNLLALSLEAAPWLVFGLVLGGLMKALIPTAFLQKHLQGRGFGSIVKAAVLGAPLPLCSCGVIPAAMGLRKAGASKPATISFLVSTPETGVDSVAVTYALMGPFMAVVRPVSALISAFVTGSLVAGFDKKEMALSVHAADIAPASETDGCCSSSTESTHEESSGSCCSSESEASKMETKSVASCCSSEPKKEVTSSCCSSDAEPEATKTSCCSSESKPETSSCCSSESPIETQPETFMQRAVSGIQYSFGALFEGIVLWLVIGMIFAALVKTFVPADFLLQWGTGLPAMIVMLLVGIPMYICATASTPVAAGLMMSGISPGVALVFLLAGPATNIGTLGIIAKELGQRSMWLYVLGTSGVALAAGLLVDFIVSNWNVDIQSQLHEGHDQLPLTIQWIGLLILLFFTLRALLHSKYFNLKNQ